MKREPLSPVKAHVKQMVDVRYHAVGVPHPPGILLSLRHHLGIPLQCLDAYAGGGLVFPYGASAAGNSRVPFEGNSTDINIAAHVLQATLLATVSGLDLKSSNARSEDQLFIGCWNYLASCKPHRKIG